MSRAKKALLASSVSLLACAALLAGTTFAWFTDSVVNTGNKIQAGNLAIGAYAYDLAEDGEGSFKIEGVNGGAEFAFETGGQNLKTDKTPIINDTLFEPGDSNAKLLKVENAGTLSAKIKLEFSVMDGGLMEALWFDFVKVENGAAVGNFTRRPMSELESIADGLELPLLENGDNVQFILIYGMDENAGNGFMGKTFTADVTILATQYTGEKDGFGNDQYDKGAEWPLSVWDGVSATALEQLDKDDAARTVSVGSAADFAGVAAAINAGELKGYTITLQTNIDLNGKAWTPISGGTRDGGSYEGENAFEGVFDGNGNTISGLTITTAAGADDAVGLFGVVDGGTVKNLQLTDVNIDVPGSELAGAAVGLLVGGGTVDSVTVSGRVKATRGNGGIVGRVLKEGTVVNCTNHAEISGTGANVGGIVGAAYYTAEGREMRIENCVNTGAVTSTQGGVGGIVGLSSAVVEGCTNTAPVTGNGASVGGIVGEQREYGSVTGCTNRAAVVNNSNSRGDFGTGGVIGWIRYYGNDSDYASKAMITVSGNRNSGNVTGGGSAGGIVGHIYNAAEVTGNVNTAGLIRSSGFAAGVAGSLQFSAENRFTEETIQVTKNVSTTPAEGIQGEYTAPFAYINDDKFIVEDNDTTEG